MAKHQWIAVRELKSERADTPAMRALNPDGAEGMPCVRVRTRDGGRPQSDHGYIEEFSQRCADRLAQLKAERETVDRLRRQGYWVVNPKPESTHSVYVIELDSAVRQQSKVRKLNPKADPSRPCYYVGQTSKSPAERLKQHQDDDSASRWVRDFTKASSSDLAPAFYERLNPMTEEAALEKEASLAAELRAQGYTVMGGH